MNHLLLKYFDMNGNVPNYERKDIQYDKSIQQMFIPCRVIKGDVNKVMDVYLSNWLQSDRRSGRYTTKVEEWIERVKEFGQSDILY